MLTCGNFWPLSWEFEKRRVEVVKLALNRYGKEISGVLHGENL